MPHYERGKTLYTWWLFFSWEPHKSNSDQPKASATNCSYSMPLISSYDCIHVESRLVGKHFPILNKKYCKHWMFSHNLMTSLRTKYIKLVFAMFDLGHLWIFATDIHLLKMFTQNIMVTHSLSYPQFTQKVSTCTSLELCSLWRCWAQQSQDRIGGNDEKSSIEKRITYQYYRDLPDCQSLEAYTLDWSG